MNPGSLLKMIVPRVKSLVGPKYIQQFQNATNSLFGFGAVAGAGLLYFTDWKAILEHIPIIKRKFAEDES